jgi:VanZ family protein
MQLEAAGAPSEPARILQLGLFDLDFLSMRRFFGIAGWLLVAAIAFLSLSPASYRPVTGVGHTLEHILIYVLVGFAFGVGYAKRLWLLIPGLVAFTAAVEFAQLFVPGRHARLRDFLIDAGAACLGIGLAWIGDVFAGAASKPTPGRTQR